VGGAIRAVGGATGTHRGCGKGLMAAIGQKLQCPMGAIGAEPGGVHVEAPPIHKAQGGVAIAKGTTPFPAVNCAVY